MTKIDIKIKDGNTLQWDHFVSQKVEIALPRIYTHAIDFSQSAREWYWNSIKMKRRGSTYARALSYGLAVIGIAGPLMAAVHGDPAQRLLFTQAGVTAIAVAGAILLCDTVFGWSSGWLRYVTTVTAMERLTLQFQLEWASYCVSRADPLVEADNKPLFDVAKALELEIDKRRGEETDGWVSEFNRGMSALNEMIKFQKDATEQAATKARTSMEEKLQSAQNGAIELSILQAPNALKPVHIFLDGTEVAAVSAATWARADVPPGLHTVRVLLDATSSEETRIAQVVAGNVVRLEFKLLSSTGGAAPPTQPLN